MKIKCGIILACLLLCTSLLPQSATDIEDVEIVNGVYFFKGTNKLYSGKLNRKFQNGKIAESIELKNGLFQGKWEKWDEDGLKKGEGVFANGTGILTIYYNYLSRKILHEIRYYNNLKNGIHVSFNEMGRKIGEVNYLKDQKDGIENGWHDNGVKSVEKGWANGLMDGPWYEWYDDGKEKISGYFKNGSGISVSWYQAGQIESFTSYVANLENGVTKGWFPNGSIELECDFKNGKVHGKLKKWDSFGKLIKYELYDDGKFEKNLSD